MSKSLYARSRHEFLGDTETGALVSLLVDAYTEYAGHPPHPAEVESWRNSLPALSNVLRAPAFENSQIFVELFMPLNNHRCDALLTGRSPAGEDAAVLVELKQWSALSKSHLPEHVHTGGRASLHPSVQVEGYADSLLHFHSAFTGDDTAFQLSGCAYLHNMKRATSHAKHLLDPGVFGSALMRCPLFFAGESANLATFIAKRIGAGSGAGAAARISGGRPLPSPKLLDLLVQTVKGEHQWRLLGVQKTAYWQIRQGVQEAKDCGERRVVVVRGGPGTGKSVLALQLLADGARQKWKVAHATGSKAFQVVLQAQTLEFSGKMLREIHGARLKKNLPVDELFATFAGVARVGAETPGAFDLVVCDEAHRLWSHRRIKYPNGKVRWLTSTSMVEELISASRVTAFFLDDNQSVRTGEIGRSEAIVAAAERLGIECEVVDLDAQFRCAGSTSYLNWVEHLCGHRELTDLAWREDAQYAVRIWSGMEALDAHLRGLKETGARVRLVAGYCWRWREPDANGTLPKDLIDPRFGGWSGAWIAKTGQFMRPLENQYYHWATDSATYEQVGSIYSAQGFEFDHVGLIWGEDLVWRGDRWVAQLGANKDNTFKKDLRSDGGDPVEKLLNVYRVLLTRGMESCHLFVLDDETRAHIQLRLSAPVARRRAVGESPSADRAAPKLTVIRGGPASVPTGADARRALGLRLVEPTADTAGRTCVPFVRLKAAAGGWSPEQASLDDPDSAHMWLTWDSAAGLSRDMFAAVVQGDSMVPSIQSGAVCLFRTFTAIETHARPVLVRHAGDLDPATGGQFTVKRLFVTSESEPRRIELRSESLDYAPLIFEGEALAAVRVLAEVVEVLGLL